MLVVSSKPLPTLNSCQHSETLPSWHQELRYGVAKCFRVCPETAPIANFSQFSARGAGASTCSYSVIFRVTLLRPSTLTGTSPSIVARRTTRCWSP